jgi:hypothetical protein
MSAALKAPDVLLSDIDKGQGRSVKPNNANCADCRYEWAKPSVVQQAASQHFVFQDFCTGRFPGYAFASNI